jgi:hypothetical protein
MITCTRRAHSALCTTCVTILEYSSRRSSVALSESVFCIGRLQAAAACDATLAAALLRD